MLNPHWTHDCIEFCQHIAWQSFLVSNFTDFSDVVWAKQQAFFLSLMTFSFEQYMLLMRDVDSHLCVTRTTARIHSFILITDIHQRSLISYTTPCYGVISHGAQFGGFQVFANHKCVHDLPAPYSILRSFVFKLRPRYMQVTHAPDKPQLLWLRKSPKTPKFSPMPGLRWYKLDLWCISVMLIKLETLENTYLDQYSWSYL